VSDLHSDLHNLVVALSSIPLPLTKESTWAENFSAFAGKMSQSVKTCDTFHFAILENGFASVEKNENKNFLLRCIIYRRWD
jgi:hypothetical protein